MKLNLKIKHYRIPKTTFHYLWRNKTGRTDHSSVKEYRRKVLAGQAEHFIPTTKGGLTYVYAYGVDVDTAPLAVGYANCSMSDNFCYKRGRQVALDNLATDLENRHIEYELPEQYQKELDEYREEMRSK